MRGQRQRTSTAAARPRAHGAGPPPPALASNHPPAKQTGATTTTANCQLQTNYATGLGSDNVRISLTRQQPESCPEPSDMFPYAGSGNCNDSSVSVLLPVAPEWYDCATTTVLFLWVHVDVAGQVRVHLRVRVCAWRGGVRRKEAARHRKHALINQAFCSAARK